MNETRRKIKRRARELCMKERSALIVVTLLYLVVTDWLEAVVEFIQANPISEITSAFSASVYNLYEKALVSGATSVDLQPAYLSAIAKGREIFSSQTTIFLLFLYVMLFLYSVIMSYGYFRCVMTQVRGGKASGRELFSMFYLAGKIILMELLVTAIILLGFIILFFPGFYFTYRYYMASYCLIDHPEESIFQAMHRSARMTRGHKLELMICDLSFWGWMLAAIVVTSFFESFGAMFGAIGAELLYLVSVTIMDGYILPYQQSTFVLYYESFRTLQPDETAS